MTNKHYYRSAATAVCLGVMLSGASAARPQTGVANTGQGPSSGTVLQNDYDNLRHTAGRVKPDEIPSIQQKAAAGDLDSQLLLAMLYQVGCGVIARDPAQNLAWYRKAADQGSSIAENQIGSYYDTGPGHDPAEAFRWYRKAAEHNDAVAQFNVGAMYEEGLGVQQSDADAAVWYRKAISNGYDRPLRSLTNMYHAGKALPGQSLEQNQKEGFVLLQSLANQGNATAHLRLAEAYQSGWLGLQQDEQQALVWLKKAAEKNAEAQAGLGWAYSRGLGVPKNEAEAVNWYRMAARQGNVNGQANLAFMYESGRGVAKDQTEAFQWYQAAASHDVISADRNVRDIANARFALAHMYEDGRGVKKDKVTAIMWFLLAQDAGGPNFMKELHPNTTYSGFSFYRHPDKEDFTEAEKRAKAWRDLHYCQ